MKKEKLLLASVAGLLASSLLLGVGCAKKAETPTTEPVVATVATANTETVVTEETATAKEKDQCKSKDGCKAKEAVKAKEVKAETKVETKKH